MLRALALAFLLTGAAGASDVRVIDGDTVVIGTERIRLHGIDAPETRQRCIRADGLTWACGEVAKARLALYARRGLTCERAGDGRDRYGRLIAKCYSDGLDVNGAMVRGGLAWAYRRYSGDYIADEDAARKARRNVWSAPNTPPWEYRRR